VDTLMKYLVDSLQRYENDYGDALCPVQNEPDQSFMGDHALMQPVTAHEFRLFGTMIMSALKTPSAVMCSLTSPVSTCYATTPTSESDYSVTSVSNDPGSTNGAKSIPLAGVCIPDLPRRRGGWRIALRQWYEIDPKTGRALKDWPDEWFKDSMRSKTAAKRSQRALIAHEYER
jgi:hypothetical protein